MNCIIIDDEKAARAILAQLCSKIPAMEVLGEFDGAMEAIKFLNNNIIDIVFLDIHMPGFSGVDFLQTFTNNFKIVMTTSDTNFAIKAYEYEAIVDYLVKPITFKRFEKSIRKIEKSLVSAVAQTNNDTEVTTDTIYINIDRRLIKLKFDQILFIEADGDYILVAAIGKVHRVHTTLKKIKEKLVDTIFLQIHRSFVINITKIIDIQDNSVLIDKKVIPISRSSRPNLMKRLNLV